MIRGKEHCDQSPPELHDLNEGRSILLNEMDHGRRILGGKMIRLILFYFIGIFSTNIPVWVMWVKLITSLSLFLSTDYLAEIIKISFFWYYLYITFCCNKYFPVFAYAVCQAKLCSRENIFGLLLKPYFSTLSPQITVIEGAAFLQHPLYKMLPTLGCSTPWSNLPAKKFWIWISRGSF